WFGSKEQLLFGVVDHAVAELGDELSAAALGAGPTLEARVRAVVDATFRLGSLRPELLAVVREVTRLGPPASTHLARAAEPLVDAASAALGGWADAPVRTAGPMPGGKAERDRIAAVLLAAGARVVGLATEAQVRADLGLPADLRWLRTRRRDLVADLLADLA
ncbi:MAG: hypothetical protein KDA97_10725, partial [Acidimicrobiales bacterium]|nr:hypothetical protein [Acidimicrobiales bacterium]